MFSVANEKYTRCITESLSTSFSKPWTDEELYAKYKLTQEEIDFIESMIKPME
jgi:hypothetical protein